jgi:hypothetical protein
MTEIIISQSNTDGVFVSEKSNLSGLTSGAYFYTLLQKTILEKFLESIQIIIFKKFRNFYSL